MIIGSGTRERTYNRDGRSWTRFEAWVEYEHEEGEARRRKRSDHETLREAEAWIRMKIAEDATDPAAAQDHGRVKVGTLLDDYLTHGETVAGWSPSHTANTKRLVARYLTPLRNRQARRLSPEDVDALMARMVREEVSPHSIRQTRNALRAAFNLAIRRRRLPQGMNPAALVDVPRTTRRSPSFVPPDQIAAFIAAVESDWLGAMYVSCALLALRPSEALALRWGDIDFDAGTVAIERSVHRVPGRRVKGQSTRDSGGEYVVRPTKTHQARTLHAPAWLLAQLKAHRERIKRAGLKAGRTDLVFPAERTGDYVYEPHARDHLKELLEGTSLEAVTMYQLRHTGITLRGFAGVPLSVIQEEAGHSNINQTRRYQQLVDAQRKQSATALDALVNAAQEAHAASSDTTSEPSNDRRTRTVGRTSGRTNRPTPIQRRRAKP